MSATSATPTVEAAKPFRRIMVCVTEDWFALSHFQPLIRTLVALAGRVLVVTRSSGRMGEIADLGAETAEFDYHRSSLDPVREARSAARLARRIRDFAPDVLHLVAMKPIVLGGLAARMSTVPHTVLHLTGLGFLGITDTPKIRLVRWLVLKQMAATLSHPGNWLLAENGEDLAYLAEAGVEAGGRQTLLGGAGVDPCRYPAQPDPGDTPVRAAYVGRMIRPKGIHVLMAAASRLAAAGVPLRVDLYGGADIGNPEAVEPATLTAWSQTGAGTWHGPTRDVAGVWRKSDVFVLPALSREGLPRALLEAAASGRPAIVTDVPGCRTFVRHEVEGLIVPPNDIPALCSALAKLATDRDLRLRMGHSARARVLEGFTVDHVTAAIERTYRSLAEPAVANS